MPRRKEKLAIGETYHIYNKSLNKQKLFPKPNDYLTFLNATEFYLQLKPVTRFSFYQKKPDFYKLDLSKRLLDIWCYCLMPNHFHFILHQKVKNGITNFMHKLSNSYAHYFNLKFKQTGPVFKGVFKAVRIKDQEQLVHLSRYIHLNPATSFLVENPIDWQFSSYKNYLNIKKNNILDPSNVMVNFTSKSYESFVINQKEYQRQLNKIKHLCFD